MSKNGKFRCEGKIWQDFHIMFCMYVAISQKAKTGITAERLD